MISLPRGRSPPSVHRTEVLQPHVANWKVKLSTCHRLSKSSQWKEKLACQTPSTPNAISPRPRPLLTTQTSRRIYLGFTAETLAFVSDIARCVRTNERKKALRSTLLLKPNSPLSWGDELLRIKNSAVNGSDFADAGPTSITLPRSAVEIDAASETACSNAAALGPLLTGLPAASVGLPHVAMSTARRVPPPPVIGPAVFSFTHRRSLLTLCSGYDDHSADTPSVRAGASQRLALHNLARRHLRNVGLYVRNILTNLLSCYKRCGVCVEDRP